MNILDKITTAGEEWKPPILTIVGEPGAGKTTLGATFPAPVIVRVEDGARSVPNTPVLPLVDNPEQLWDQLKALVKKEHPYKTVVIDSVTQLDKLFEKAVIDKSVALGKGDNITTALGGYQAGATAVAGMHDRLRRAANALQRKGIAVVFIAHSKVEMLNPPDGEAYARYTLDVPKKSQIPYTANVDMIAHIARKVSTTKDSKVVDHQQHVVYVGSDSAHQSKNRYHLTGRFIVKQGENPLLDALYKGEK